ncbi:MAG: HupE/UreJ family protein [Flavobacteriaceae bacterium]|tara:strand:- start:460 stop:1038 length:579 start_codon:yes stop_codon:yes gene_type:complete
MIDILWVYIKLGFWHVVDWEGLDHFYFIITLAMPFTFLKIRKLIWWVTLFTLGHTLSLIGNFYFELYVSSYWIELLIPITIALNAITLFFPKKFSRIINKAYLPPLVTVLFGVIHGLGFGRYFNMLIPEDDVSLSLFSFAIGVEFAQIAIVIGILLISFIVTQVFKQSKERWEFLVGAMILSQALTMIFERI